MDIHSEETKTGGRYSVELENGAGEMTYTRRSPELISLDHTHVDETLRGQGVAAALAEHAVAEARKGGWKIIPACSYMRALANRHADWNDVIQNA